jgi:hypothetical protein
VTQSGRRSSHEEQHKQVRDGIEGWEGETHLVYNRLLVHLGAYHDYNPSDLDNDGLVPLLAWHDVVHGSDDSVGVEKELREKIVANIAGHRQRIRGSATS